MKATCQQDQLARGLAMVGRAVPARSTLPVLSNILVATGGKPERAAGTGGAQRSVIASTYSCFSIRSTSRSRDPEDRP